MPRTTLRATRGRDASAELRSRLPRAAGLSVRFDDTTRSAVGGDGCRRWWRRSSAPSQRSGLPVHRMASGAGHDAMILAGRMPAAMLFLRSPGGISHHPDETVLEE